MTRVSRLLAHVVVATIAACDAGAHPPETDAAGSAALTADTTARHARAKARALEILRAQGLRFEANRGQSDPAVQFLARGRGYELFLTATEAVVALHAPTPREVADRAPKPARERLPAPRPASVIRMRLAGSNPTAHAEGLDPLPGTASYFIGRDPAKWRTGIPSYARVKYTGVYPGIDVVYYSAAGELEYDFVVAPGAHPGQIAMEVEGGTAVTLAQDGDVVVGTPSGDVRIRRPVAYQDVDGERRAIESRYVVAPAPAGRAARRVSVQVARYDVSRPLVIDPVLVYSTYLGGSNETVARSIAVDAVGSAYVTGYTFATDFPVRNPLPDDPGPNPAFTVGGAFVTKIDAGGALIYSTYLRGSDPEGSSFGLGIAVDHFGAAYVTGTTPHLDFPTTPGAYRPERSCQEAPFVCQPFATPDEAFVVKLSPAGSSLVYSTFLGGATFAMDMGIATDAEGHAYVAGFVYPGSPPFTPPFPIVNAERLGAAGDVYTAFVVKLTSPGDDVVYSTLLGGSLGSTFASRIAADDAGQAYVVGSTIATDFPTKLAIQDQLNGGFPADDDRFVLLPYDAFITKLDRHAQIVYSTFLGGRGFDEARDVTVDRAGSAHVVGATTSSDFPLKNPLQILKAQVSFPTDDGNVRVQPRYAFVAKLAPEGSSLTYSTYFGTPPVVCPSPRCGAMASGIAVDAAGNAYVTGLTTIPDFPVTSGAIQRQGGGGTIDAFLSQLDPTGTVLRFSTFLGGSGVDDGMALALDPLGGVHVTGRTTSQDFPTQSAFQTQLPAGASTSAFVLHVSFAPEERAPLEFVTFPAALPSLPPTAVVGQPYVGNVGLGGGRPPYGVSVVRGALPRGLRLGNTGPASAAKVHARATGSCLPPGGVGSLTNLVLGTPEVAESACVEVCATDADNPQGVLKRFQITALLSEDQQAGVPAGLRTLRVTHAGSGRGTVEVVAPGAVAPTPVCDGCVLQYVACADVRLTARGDAGSSFAGWRGGGCEGSSPGQCDLLLNDDITVTAQFEAEGTTPPPPPLGLVAAVLPASRSVAVGHTATVSATMIATGTGVATGCRVALDGGPPVTLSYQPYDAGTGQPTGDANVPVALTAGVPRALLLAVTPAAAFEAAELILRFTCANATPVTPISGVNTLLLSAAATTPPDVVVLAATPSGDGIVRVPAVGAAAFAVATVNVGAGAELTLTADTGDAALPIALAVCATAATGQCLAPPGPGATRRIEPGETPTYTVFVTAAGVVAGDAARHRVYVRFRDAGGAVRGAASVSVETVPLTVAAD